MFNWLLLIFPLHVYFAIFYHYLSSFSFDEHKHSPYSILRQVAGSRRIIFPSSIWVACFGHFCKSNASHHYLFTIVVMYPYKQSCGNLFICCYRIRLIFPYRLYFLDYKVLILCRYGLGGRIFTKAYAKHEYLL